MPTLERIGNKICPVLVKLAEINFLEAEFQESERTIDAILSRQSLDKKTLIFAYLLKYYFLALKSDHELSLSYLQKAHQIQPDAKVYDLDLFRKLRDRQNPTLIVFNHKAKTYQALEGTDNRKSLVLQANQVTSFPALLCSLIESILKQTNLEQFCKSEFVYDCSEYIQLLETQQMQFLNSWNEQESVQLKQEDEVMVETKSQVIQQIQDKKQPKGLRKKPDNTEQQIRSMQLQRFQPYRDHIYKSLGGIDDSFLSCTEIIMFQKLLQKENESDILPQTNTQKIKKKVNPGILQEFYTILKTKLNMKNCCYFIRNLLRYLAINELITFQNSKLVFKLFLMQPKAYETMSPEVFQIMFEMTLFNQAVIKDNKSGPIMQLRTQFYDFCITNYNDLVTKMDQSLKFRFDYAMMFTAFEIKNDMQKSVQFYEKLDFALLSSQSFPLPWVSDTFEIDCDQVSQFGNQKIKQAQQINIQNSSLREMKQNEFESTKTCYTRLTCVKQTAQFYLEQFFVHITGLIQSNDAIGINFQLNDDKLKEMWDQLMFCLIRVTPNSDFFVTSSFIFSMLSAFKSLSKNLFDTVILKKIDFTALLEEISERLRQLVFDSGIFQSNYDCYYGLTIKILQKQQIQAQTLNKILTHLVRMVTPDFFYFNVKVGGSAANLADPGQPFLTQLFKCMFYLDLIKSNIAQDNLQSVALLLKQLDQTAQEQQELIMRPYSRLFIISFPLILRSVNNGAKDNDLIILVLKSFKYLFNFVSSEQQTENSLSDEIVVEEATELSLFAGMSNFQADKPKYPLPNPTQIFQSMAQNQKKELDHFLLCDVIKFADLNSNNRLLSNKLTKQDIQNCIKLVDNIAKLIQMKDLSKRDEENTANVFKCFKENPFFVMQEPINQNSGFHTVIKFLISFQGQLSLQVYPYTAVMPYNKRYKFIEKLSSLRDLKKLRSLIRLDMQFSDNLVETALFSSFIDLQYYMQAADSKLLLDYKNAESYNEQRQCKEFATNTAIWALNESLQKNDLQKCLEALHQLLSIFYIRVMSKRDILKQKFSVLVGVCFYLAQVCEQVQCFITTPRKDPRMAQVNQQLMHSQARSIIQDLLAQIKQSFANGTSRACLIPNIQESMSNLQKMDQQIYKLLPKEQLNPDYPFIQVILSKFSGFDAPDRELTLLKRAFDLAISTQDQSTVFETLLYLIEKQLQLTIEYKYTKQNQDQIKLIVEQITKPFLQDAETYIQKLSNESDEVLYDQRSSHLVRQKLHLFAILQDQQGIEGIIFRLYKAGDTIVTLLSQRELPIQWISIKYKTMLLQSLVNEICFIGNNENLKLLVEVQGDQIIQEIYEAEEQFHTEQFGQQPIFCTQQFILSINTIQDRQQKSLITMYQCFSIHRSISELRLKSKFQLLQLWEQTLDYEHILSVYRKQQEIYKKSLTKLSENAETFSRAKDVLIKTFYQYVDRKLEDFLKIKQQYTDFTTSKNQAGYTQCRQIYKDFRLKWELSVSNQLPLVKDIFDLFLDSHFSRSFSKKNNLFSEYQKKIIRQTLFKTCALTGPDEETEPGAPKFLDLQKMDDQDYFEVMQICVKWYTNFLDNNKKAKKDSEMVKKLQACLDEIKEIDLKPLKQEIPAQKVFSQKKL